MIKNKLVVLSILLCSATSALAQVSIGIGLPHVSIGINLPLYPELEPIPGYPVYYAPRLNSNYFFYDGLYWVYQGDGWYASSWYNGPWAWVEPENVPLFVLRIPVRYYRQPPAYFIGWQLNAPPRWGEHWGNAWEQRRRGWDQWNRNSAPAPAPLPAYQKKYTGDRYPRAEQQPSLQSRNYHYQPHDPVVRQQTQTQRVHSVPASPQREPQQLPQGDQHSNSPAPVQHRTPGVPQTQAPQDRTPVQQPQFHGRETGQNTQAPQNRTPVPQPQQQPKAQSHSQATQSHGKGAAPEPGQQGKQPAQEPGHSQGNGHENDREKSDGRGQDHGH